MYYLERSYIAHYVKYNSESYCGFYCEHLLLSHHIRFISRVAVQVQVRVISNKILIFSKKIEFTYFRIFRPFLKDKQKLVDRSKSAKFQ